MKRPERNLRTYVKGAALAAEAGVLVLLGTGAPQEALAQIKNCSFVVRNEEQKYNDNGGPLGPDGKPRYQPEIDGPTVGGIPNRHTRVSGGGETVVFQTDKDGIGRVIEEGRLTNDPSKRLDAVSDTTDSQGRRAVKVKAEHLEAGYVSEFTVQCSTKPLRDITFRWNTYIPPEAVSAGVNPTLGAVRGMPAQTFNPPESPFGLVPTSTPPKVETPTPTPTLARTATLTMTPTSEPARSATPTVTTEARTPTPVVTATSVQSPEVAKPVIVTATPETRATAIPTTEVRPSPIANLATSIANEIKVNPTFAAQVEIQLEEARRSGSLLSWMHNIPGVTWIADRPLFSFISGMGLLYAAGVWKRRSQGMGYRQSLWRRGRFW